MKSLKTGKRRGASARLKSAILALPLSLPVNTQAAFFQGEALDTAADVMSWVVLIVVPIVCIAVFLLVHILPEKIAEKKKHPQVKAIQTLCVLSLFFGGLLWPLAWLWAYSKPVLYKMAYGTDTVEHGQEADAEPTLHTEAADEFTRLRRQIDELETRLTTTPSGKAGKA